MHHAILDGNDVNIYYVLLLHILDEVIHTVHPPKPFIVEPFIAEANGGVSRKSLGNERSKNQ